LSSPIANVGSTIIIENLNGEVGRVLDLGPLRRVLAQVDVSYSNSLIEAWWRFLRQQVGIVASTVRSVFRGVIGTAPVQGVLAMFGFWLAGVPNAFLLGVATCFLSLVPGGSIIRSRRSLCA